MAHPRALLLAFALIFSIAVLPAYAVTITFETRPDGTPIQNEYGCGEIAIDTFRPWGVLFSSADDSPLDIQTTLSCLSPRNSLGFCTQNGAINITFVLPGTNTPTVIDRIDLAMLTGTPGQWQGRVNTYDSEGVLLNSWDFLSIGFCGEPPFWYDFYHFSAPGRIARVECVMFRVGIDNVVVTEASTPVDGSTWGRIKAFYQ